MMIALLAIRICMFNLQKLYRWVEYELKALFMGAWSYVTKEYSVTWAYTRKIPIITDIFS